ncbi:MAG TPA: hypothetical protein VMC61_01815, partial [Methanocella sp.]|nr:hypothetical protein [Methanocella sp.]
MRDIMTILQNAILYVAGNEGIAKFNKAGYGSVAKDIVHADGSLDLPRLMNIMLDVFPEEQASAIADNVLAKYVEMPDEEKKIPQAKPDEAPVPDENGMSYEDNLANYLETEASDVQDLINEARLIRMAMGKVAPQKATNGGAIAQAMKPLGHEPDVVPSTPTISIVNPGVPEPIHDLKPPVPEPVRGNNPATEPAPKQPRIDIDAFTAKTRP